MAVPHIALYHAFLADDHEGHMAGEDASLIESRRIASSQRDSLSCNVAGGVVKFSLGGTNDESDPRLSRRS
jgi:hypothetical protein